MKITVSMAHYDDFDGVFFTIQAIRMYQGHCNLEFIVLDNNPGSPHSDALKGFSKAVPGMRVIPVTDRKSSFVKYDVFDHATGDVVLGLDCHVLLAPGFFTALIQFWTDNLESKDLLTGPLIYNDLATVSTHMDPVWRGHEFGIWATDRQGLHGEKPFEVSMQGMGCFSVWRNSWKGLTQGFNGFGGEEWYVAEKIRSWGGRVMCHPNLKWMHRFDWPKRAFPLTWEDKIMNYYRGWLDIYGSTDHPMVKDMTEEWKKLFPEDKLEKLIQRAQTT